jgi:hypothetical protein
MMGLGREAKSMAKKVLDFRVVRDYPSTSYHHSR